MRTWDHERLAELIDGVDDNELREIFQLLVQWIHDKEDVEEDY